MDQHMHILLGSGCQTGHWAQHTQSYDAENDHWAHGEQQKRILEVAEDQDCPEEWVQEPSSRQQKLGWKQVHIISILFNAHTWFLSSVESITCRAHVQFSWLLQAQLLIWAGKRGQLEWTPRWQECQPPHGPLPLAGICGSLSLPEKSGLECQIHLERAMRDIIQRSMRTYKEYRASTSTTTRHWVLEKLLLCNQDTYRMIDTYPVHQIKSQAWSHTLSNVRRKQRWEQMLTWGLDTTHEFMGWDENSIFTSQWGIFPDEETGKKSSTCITRWTVEVSLKREISRDTNPWLMEFMSMGT